LAFGRIGYMYLKAEKLALVAPGGLIAFIFSGSQDRELSG
jgi:hypothetical protein